VRSLVSSGLERSVFSFFKGSRTKRVTEKPGRARLSIEQLEPRHCPAPVISNFAAVSAAPNVWTFQGQVTDESTPALTVSFGGLPSLGARMVTVNSNGWFSLTVELQDGEDGTATAQTTNSFGLDSNVAETLVAPA